jgi:hypothetical protein
VIDRKRTITPEQHSNNHPVQNYMGTVVLSRTRHLTIPQFIEGQVSCSFGNGVYPHNIRRTSPSRRSHSFANAPWVTNCPPSTTIMALVTCADAELTRNSITPPISDGAPSRPTNQREHDQRRSTTSQTRSYRAPRIGHSPIGCARTKVSLAFLMPNAVIFDGKTLQDQG